MMLSFFTAAANAVRRSTASAISAGDAIQPSQPSIDFCAAGSALQAAPSRAHSAAEVLSAVALALVSAPASGPGARCREL